MANLTALQARVANILAATGSAPPNGDAFVFRSTLDSLLLQMKPTRGQFMRALEASGAGRVAACANMVPSDRSHADNIAWNHSGVVKANSPLALFVKRILALQDSEINTLITQAIATQE